MTDTSPSTPEHLRYHARSRPDAIALIDGDRKIDYATFHGDVARFTRALRTLAFPRGSAVAVTGEGFYLHWLLLLACENLGWATASFLPGENESLGGLLAAVQLVLSRQSRPAAAFGPRWHVMTPEWLNDVFASPLPEETGDGDVGLRPEEVHRLRRSSGSTGSIKLMASTRAAEDHRIAHMQALTGVSAQSRFIVSTPFTVGSTYSRATGCLRLGATCIVSRGDLARDIVTHRPTHVRLFQFQIKSVLDGLPADFARPESLTVIVGAAPLPEEARAALLERLATRISYAYAANEIGPIAAIGSDGICTVLPGVEAEVVDANGAPVPAGSTGRIRLRGPGMIDGYLADPELTASALRDGWFHTGDAAVKVAPRQFRLTGRMDLALNIGGRKFMPEQIEASIGARCAAVNDVGVTSVIGSGGAEEIGIAIVVKDGARFEEQRRQMSGCLPPDPGTVHVRVVNRIPRSAETGKIRRAELKELFALK